MQYKTANNSYTLFCLFFALVEEDDKLLFSRWHLLQKFWRHFFCGKKNVYVPDMDSFEEYYELVEKEFFFFFDRESHLQSEGLQRWWATRGLLL